MAGASPPWQHDIARRAVDLFWRVDSTGRLIEASPGLESDARFDALARSVGAPALRLLHLYRPDDRIRLGEALRRRGPFRQVRARLRCSETPDFVLSLDGFPWLTEDGAFRGYEGAAVDISEVFGANELASPLEVAAAHATGKSYLDAVLRSVGEFQGVDIVFIGRTIGRPPHSVEVEAVHARNGDLEPGLIYGLPGTPCARAAVSSTVCAFPDSVSELFPDDTILSELGIRGYVGIPLFDREGGPLGIAVLMSRAPLDPRCPSRTLLSTLAKRLSVELERKRADDQRADTERRLRTVLDNLPVAYLERNTDGTVVFVNRLVREWWDLPEDALLGLTFAEINARSEDFNGIHVSSQGDEMVYRDLRVVSFDREAVLADGTRHEVVVTKFPILSQSGEMERMGAIGVDVTDPRRRHRLSAMGQMAGGVAHDFNNILGAIQGFATFLVEDLEDQAQSRGYAQRIVTASERGRALVEQILSFARARDVKQGVVDLGRAVEAAVELAESELAPEITAVPVQVEIGDGDFRVFGNEAQLIQLSMNLVRNALQASSGRAGSVTVGLEHYGRATWFGDCHGSDSLGRLSLGEVDPTRQYAVLRVTDRGRGIAASALPGIIEPFRTNRSTRGGTGLGLAVVAAVAEAHRAIVMIESEIDVGTAVKVGFPLHVAQVAVSSGPARPPVPQSAGTPRILVIDDEADVAEVVSIGLARLGFETVTATDPVQAVHDLQARPEAFAAVISDQVMPGLQGLDLLKRLRSDRLDIPFVLCTGYSERVDEEKALKAGATAFFYKPVNISELGSALRRALG